MFRPDFLIWKLIEGDALNVFAGLDESLADLIYMDEAKSLIGCFEVCSKRLQ